MKTGFISFASKFIKKESNLSNIRESWEVTKPAQEIKDRPPKMHFYQVFGDRIECEQNKTLQQMMHQG